MPKWGGNTDWNSHINMRQNKTSENTAIATKEKLVLFLMKHPSDKVGSFLAFSISAFKLFFLIVVTPPFIL